MVIMLLLNIITSLYYIKVCKWQFYNCVMSFNQIVIVIVWKIYIYVHIYDVQNLFLGSTWWIWKVNESLQLSSNMVQSTVLLRPHQVTFLNLMLLLEFWKRALSAVKVLLSGISPPKKKKRKEKKSESIRRMVPSYIITFNPTSVYKANIMTSDYI